MECPDPSCPSRSRAPAGAGDRSECRCQERGELCRRMAQRAQQAPAEQRAPVSHCVPGADGRWLAPPAGECLARTLVAAINGNVEWRERAVTYRAAFAGGCVATAAPRCCYCCWCATLLLLLLVTATPAAAAARIRIHLRCWEGMGRRRWRTRGCSLPSIPTTSWSTNPSWVAWWTARATPRAGGGGAWLGAPGSEVVEGSEAERKGGAALEVGEEEESGADEDEDEDGDANDNDGRR